MGGVLSNKIQRDQLRAGDHIYSWRHAYIYAHHGIYMGNGNVIHFTRGAGLEMGYGALLDRFILNFSASANFVFGKPSPEGRNQLNVDRVIQSSLASFLAGGELYRFEYSTKPAIFLAKPRGGTCTLAASDPTQDILNRASILLQNGFGVYDLFKNNCEDFAIYCKTGLLVFTPIRVGRSGQAVSIMAATSAIVSSPLRFLTTSSLGLAVFSSPLRFLTTSSLGLAVFGYGVYCMSRLVSDIGLRRDVAKVPVQRLVIHQTLKHQLLFN